MAFEQPEQRSMRRKNVKGLGLALNAPQPQQPAQSSLGSQIGSVRNGRVEQENRLEIGAEFRLDLRNDDLTMLKDLGAGNGGTVTKVEHKITKAVMARKVDNTSDFVFQEPPR